jgi:hypothetical protein
MIGQYQSGVLYLNENATTALKPELYTKLEGGEIPFYFLPLNQNKHENHTTGNPPEVVRKEFSRL